MKILIATNNKHKIKEITEIFADTEYEVVCPNDINLKLDVIENGTTFAENSYKKANAFCRATGLISIADDSGLQVRCLDNAPGIYSARYGGIGLDDAGRTQLLLKNMEGKADRYAEFVCAISVVFPSGRLIKAQGKCEGNIALSPSTNVGFGYDPVFIPKGYDKTFAELSSEIKNSISHRGNALKQLKQKLAQIDGDTK